ncbi:SWI5-dependent HO expression protein 4 [Didymosphaeria variabile]|uniref:SWI5-dependent HO expression protein 4 n=1 Tax=Didymosphaeria variabile TaxID=1932322 RepID=A0A9W8XKF4_9PLEO|nr:SWI5-dependent HO expression protein 4 [Didymosphaeria variabile]KAJ4353231.1 SWI5-dependent HO expression protein 4 [Didymosphaeria variabile]
MPSTSEAERAVGLAQQATDKIKSGKLSDAARLLREATTIAPEHPLIKQTWVALKEEEEKSELLGVCKDWVKSRDEADGDEALKLIRATVLGEKEAEQAMSILYDFKGEDDLLDQVTGELLMHVGAQRWLAGFVKEHPTQAYYELFERGDDSIDGLIKALLNRAVWESDEAFVQGHRDCFMLSLAMMMEEALEHPERAMKGVAQLLAHHAQDLHGIIDADSFDVILTSLDIRLPSSLRSQATLATIKLFELAPSTAQDLISKFVISRVQKSIADGLVVAFSAAAAIFPITAQAAAQLFLSEGFVSTLVPLVEGKNSTKLEQAALELISAACIDKNCREAINRHCRTWLEDHIASCPDKKRANLAALVLVKLGDEQATSEGPQIVTPGKVDQDDLIASFKSMVISSDSSGKQDSIEGLAYASLQPKVREDLSKSPKFLKHLIGSMKEAATSPNILFGGLTIFVNLTTFPPIQSEEEKRMAQLKAYANVQKPTVPDPLLDEAHTTVRCKRVLDAGIVPLLVGIAKKASPAALTHTTSILLSLSMVVKSRPALAQQGAVKLLVQIYDTLTSSSNADKYPPTAAPQAAQALSRILISTNPTHIFTAAFSSHSVLRPLTSLLSQSESSTWQLHAFESLLALTNLASMDQSTQDAIIRTAFDTVVDDLLLSQNVLLRRASTELLCNLMASPLCAEKFADGSPRAGKRLHLLCALTDVEDGPTRSAAGGALAMLLSIDLAVMELLKLEKGVDFLLGLCRDEDENVRHRGVACVREVVAIGPKGIDAVKAKGGEGALKALLKESRSQVVLGLGVETLKILLGQT